MNFRFIHDNNGTLADTSVNVNNYYSGTTGSIAFVAADDKLYIGSIQPFNSMYFKLSTAASTDGGISIKYWDGSTTWRSAVEVHDETVGFTSSGYISWQVDRQYGWSREDTVDGSGAARIAALSSVTIYDMFWAEITFATDETFVLDWIGQIFSNDNELQTEYPELLNTSLLTAIESGKTDYEEQNVRASRILVDDLITKGIIKHQSNILDKDKLTTIAVCKVAELVYNMLGDDYIDQKREARNEYRSRLKKVLFNVDANSDADLSVGERKTKQGFGYR